MSELYKPIKSFEVSSDGEFGDIVSLDRKRKSRKLRIGILPLLWFEWLSMFPESVLEASLRHDYACFMHTIQERFGGRYDLIIPSFTVDTLNAAYDAGVLFKESSVEAIVLCELTYVTDYIPLQAIDALPDVPIIVFAVQATKNLWDGMTNIDVIRYEGLVGHTQLVSAFRKIGRSCEIVVGALDDNGSYDNLDKHLAVLMLRSTLRNLDIGLIGHTFRGMYDIEIDKTSIKGALGPNILYLDVSHLLALWKALTPSEITEATRRLRRELPIPYYGVDEEDFRKSTALGLAVEKLIIRFGLGALSLLGQHYVEAGTQSSADLAFYCAERMGCMTSHEGDLANLVVKLILNKLAGELPVFLEWTAFDKDLNTLFLTHHGVVDPRAHAANLLACRFTPSCEKWDYTGNGLSVEYCARAGRVTLASLLCDTNGWRFILSRGTLIERPVMPSYAPQFHFQHDSLPVVDYIHAILEAGAPHHICLIRGDYSSVFRLFARYTGIPITEI